MVILSKRPSINISLRGRDRRASTLAGCRTDADFLQASGVLFPGGVGGAGLDLIVLDYDFAHYLPTVQSCLRHYRRRKQQRCKKQHRSHHLNHSFRLCSKPDFRYHHRLSRNRRHHP